MRVVKKGLRPLFLFEASTLMSNLGLMNSEFTTRWAVEADIDPLRAVMKRAIEHLQDAYLTPEQVKASHETMGMDTQLIADGTYLVVESEGKIAGCGGWSMRSTLFGGDHSAGRDASFLDPATGFARIRAMYTNPDFARRGVGSLVINTCEAEALKRGFTRTELMATLSGEPLYRACGYLPVEHIEVESASGVKVPLIRMQKHF